MKKAKEMMKDNINNIIIYKNREYFTIIKVEYSLFFV